MFTTKPLDDILNRLQINGETRRKAQEIFREANHLTRPGSAYAITKGLQALPAVCLFVASSRLGNTDITKEVARNVACVDLKTFEKVQSSIERALSSSQSTSSSPTKTRNNSITYGMLIQQYNGREDAHVPMLEVERAVVQSRMADDTSTPLFQGAIFAWVYINVFKLNVPSEESVRQQVNASTRDWSSARRIITKCCSSMKDVLISQAEAAATSRRTTRQTSRTLLASSLFTVTPSSKAPQQLNPSMGPAFPGSGRITSRMKRKPSVINIIEEMSSPSKRPKTTLFPISKDNDNDNDNLTTPVKSGNSIQRAQTDKVSTVDANDSDAADIPNETIVILPIRSTIAITSDLDNRESKLSLKKTIPVASIRSPLDTLIYETPSKNNMARIVETPMTTTGMSDASTPSSSSLPITKLKPTQPYRGLHIQSFPALNRKQFPLINEEDEEEISRRQRRNLRAAFLDPDVYGWKPSPNVSRRLELAKSWERTLTESFGDPWDELFKTRRQGKGEISERKKVK